MFTFDVYCLSIWYNTHHSLNSELIKKHQLTLQNGAGLCMTSSAIPRIKNQLVHTSLSCTLKPASNF